STDTMLLSCALVHTISHTLPDPHLCHHSFPTRRSSDLKQANRQAAPGAVDAMDGNCAHRVIYSHFVEEEHGFDDQDSGDEPEERSEEHTSELQSHLNLVCRLLLEKKIATDC